LAEQFNNLPNFFKNIRYLTHAFMNGFSKTSMKGKAIFIN